MKNCKVMIQNLLILFILFGLLSSPVFSNDWPKWKGPNATGMISVKALNPKAIENAAAVEWKTTLGWGHSSISVKGHYLYTLGNKEMQTNGQRTSIDTVYCLDTRTGKEVWQYSYPVITRRFPGPRATPTVDGNRLYTLSAEGHLYCFQAETGKILWKVNLVEAGLSKVPDWGFSGSPVVEVNLLILAAGKSGTLAA